MAVFVLNKQKNPMMLCSEKRARLLLERGRAIIVRRYPFTIRLKLDPGSRTPGLALVREDNADTHLLHNREVSNITYQKGELVGYLMRQKTIKGIRTSDIVRGVIPSGKKVGTYTCRVAVSAIGSFNIQTAKSVVQGISHWYRTHLQRNDGYAYFSQPSIALNKNEAARQVA
jgi:hypothetical protein